MYSRKTTSSPLQAPVFHFGWGLLCAAVLLVTALQEAVFSVSRVIDGDTIALEFEGRMERVRYIGIDTPELNDPRARVREEARKATEANARLVSGGVSLEFDVAKRDRYDRLLAYVWVGDTLVNEWLVEQGYAAPATYPPNVKYADRFRRAAAAARGEVAPSTPNETLVLTANQAAEHIGETATICGRVASTRHLEGGRSPTFLNLEEPYPDQPFTVVIWGDDRAKFEGSPELVFSDSEICVVGEIELYRSKPQVVVRDPGQITVCP